MKFRFESDVYPAIFYITNTKEEFENQYWKIFNEEYEVKSSNGLCASQGGEILVGVFNNTHSTLSHELDHAIINLFEHIGMTVSNETSEAYCYFKGYLMKKCLKGFGVKDEIFNGEIDQLKDENEKLREQLKIITEIKAEPASHEYKKEKK